MNKRNQVNLSGTISELFKFHHQSHGRQFYSGAIKMQRTSGVYDTIKIIIPESLVFNCEIGERLTVSGEWRSYNSTEKDNKIHLKLTVFAQHIQYGDIAKVEDENEIYLDGYICKTPVFRKTPQGRSITDLLIAVNRDNHRSDYIPAIAWGHNALFAQHLTIGDHINITGRIQSREYIKKYDDKEPVTKTAYEVSINSIGLVQEITDENIR